MQQQVRIVNEQFNTSHALATRGGYDTLGQRVGGEEEFEEDNGVGAEDDLKRE
jgi:hypothetical protein